MNPTSANLGNPITFGTIPDLLLAVLNVLLIIALPIVVLYLIYAGFLYVAARGNPEELKQANRALTFGIIGGVVVAGAFAILQIVSSLVEAFG
jgi:hypothetical protein